MTTARTDRELLFAWRAGDRRAGNELIVRHTPYLLRFLRNKVPEQAIEDLLQQILEGCVEGLDAFREEAAFRTYLVQIARFKIASFYRGKQRRAKVFDQDVYDRSIEDMGAGPSTLLAASEEQRLVLQALRRLGMDEQIVLEQYYFEGMTAAELGEVVGVGEPTMRGRIKRAKRHLKALIEELGGDTPAARRALLNLGAWVAEVRALLASTPARG